MNHLPYVITWYGKIQIRDVDPVLLDPDPDPEVWLNSDPDPGFFLDSLKKDRKEVEKSRKKC